MVKIPKVKPLDPMVDWNIKLMNVPMAWQYTKGKGIVVGLIDTSVDITHRDLGWEGNEQITGNDSRTEVIRKYSKAMTAVREERHPTILPGWNFVDQSDYIADLDFQRHGTYLAGTIAAVENGFGTTGIAPEAKIRPYVVINKARRTTPKARRTTPDMVGEAIIRAINDGCDVINISLVSWKSDYLDTALDRAMDKDIIVVLPTGNDNRASCRYPASTGKGIIVGGCNAIGKRWVHGKHLGSNYGEPMLCITPADAQVSLNTWRSRFTKAEATSQAAANMSGVVALMLSMVKDNVKTLISENCSLPVSTEEEGYGVPDVGKIIKYLHEQYNVTDISKVIAELRCHVARISGELALMDKTIDKLK